jgi:hypothetical protein
MIDQLVKLALENPNLNEFEIYIIKEFGVSAKVLYTFVNALSINSESKSILGRKLLILWIRYKLFDIMNIFKSAETVKRNKITEFLAKYDFDKKNIKDFLIETFKIAGEDIALEEITDYQDMIMEGREPGDLEIIFSPKTL